MNKDTQLIYEAYLKEGKWGDTARAAAAAAAFGVGGGQIGHQIGQQQGHQQGKEQGYEKGYEKSQEQERWLQNMQGKYDADVAENWFNKKYGPENKDFKKNFAMARSGKVPSDLLMYVLHKQGYITTADIQDAHDKIQRRSINKSIDKQSGIEDTDAGRSYASFPNIVLTDPDHPYPVFKKDEITKMWTDFARSDSSSQPDYVTKRPHPLFRQTTNIALARAGGEDREGPPISPSMYDIKSVATASDKDAPAGLDCDNYAECFKQFVSKRLNYSNGVGTVAGPTGKAEGHVTNLVLVSDEHGLKFGNDPDDPGFSIVQFEPQGAYPNQFAKSVKTGAGQSPTIYW